MKQDKCFLFIKTYFTYEDAMIKINLSVVHLTCVV